MFLLKEKTQNTKITKFFLRVIYFVLSVAFKYYIKINKKRKMTLDSKILNLNRIVYGNVNLKYKKKKCFYCE